jgi:predicted DNA-binding ribbon-helix-helix protein
MDVEKTSRAAAFSPLQRSIRIHGVSTCLRIEKIYWEILSSLAREQKTPLSNMLSDWDIEARTNHDEIKNFSAYVRVKCVAHLLQEIQTSDDRP